MNVLRENKESLMAVLEAFVYDPLISKRQQYLLATQLVRAVLKIGEHSMKMPARELPLINFLRRRYNSRRGRVDAMYDKQKVD